MYHGEDNLVLLSLSNATFPSVASFSNLLMSQACTFSVFEWFVYMQVEAVQFSGETSDHLRMYSILIARGDTRQDFFLNSSEQVGSLSEAKMTM